MPDSALWKLEGAQPTRPEEEGVPKKSGEGTHIVSLVKVHRAGDRRETFVPVVTVPVHS